MANPNFKGRPVGSGKSTFIEDPLMGNYKIAIDEYSFNVVDTKKNKTLGFHTSLPQAILSIAKYQMLKEKTFDTCFDILKNKGNVIIFPEGNHNYKKSLRPLKKGVSRI